MGKKAKAKLMRVWVIEADYGFMDEAYKSFRAANKDAVMLNRLWSHVGDSYRVIEFVAVTPRKRQKGKSK